MKYKPFKRMGWLSTLIRAETTIKGSLEQKKSDRNIIPSCKPK